MFSPIRKRLTYANVVATFALVFAMSGGAYAASKFLITSSKQIKPSVFASLKGKAGANGANGAPGAQGSAGPVGAGGAQGPAGPQGPAGEKGAAGTEGKAGKNGANGKEGEPWTAGGTLPPGKTETGTWLLEVEQGIVATEVKGVEKEVTIGESGGLVPISFPIPLATGLVGGGLEEESCTASGSTECHAHLILPGGNEEQLNLLTKIPSAHCHGSVVDPTADPGNLCIYTSVFHARSNSNDIYNTPNKNGPELEDGATGKAGARIRLEPETEGGQLTDAGGTWAVTAP